MSQDRSRPSFNLNFDMRSDHRANTSQGGTSQDQKKLEGGSGLNGPAMSQTSPQMLLGSGKFARNPASSISTWLQYFYVQSGIMTNSGASPAGTVQDEGLKKLLMSWYYAGYYTGLYEGQQQQQQTKHQSQD